MPPAPMHTPERRARPLGGVSGRLVPESATVLAAPLRVPWIGNRSGKSSAKGRDSFPYHPFRCRGRLMGSASAMPSPIGWERAPERRVTTGSPSVPGSKTVSVTPVRVLPPKIVPHLLALVVPLRGCSNHRSVVFELRASSFRLLPSNSELWPLDIGLGALNSEFRTQNSERRTRTPAFGLWRSGCG